MNLRMRVLCEWVMGHHLSAAAAISCSLMLISGPIVFRTRWRALVIPDDGSVHVAITDVQASVENLSRAQQAPPFPPPKHSIQQILFALELMGII
jgi:hypothetical protein